MNITPEKPIAGLLAPLFAIRSENDLGIGDTESLRQFIDWAASYGFRLVQLLPINETGADNSPYMAVSSVALDPTTIFISPESIPDLSKAEFEKILGEHDHVKLQAGSVNYRLVKPLKRALLTRAFDNFLEKALRQNGSRARKFRAFVKEQSAWIDGYALFRALMDENGGSERWDLWPAEQATAKSALKWLKKQSAAKRREFERRMKYYKYVQWLAFSQWRELKTYCDKKGVALMGDVPFGVSYYSADVFSQPEIFDLTWSGGAPPEKIFKSDPFTEKWGQNWGVPLYRWDVMRGDNFAWWRQRVHGVREMFHLFRIDHVLGFYRIYSFPWRPEKNDEFLPLSEHDAKARTGGRLPQFLPRDDWSWENADANRREGEEFLHALTEQVGQNRLIGEDLGVVPDYVRPNLASLGIAGFKIPMWERKHGGWFIDGKDYQRLSVAAYATHDHPPLKSLWDELCDECASKDHHTAGHALHELRALAAFAGIHSHLPHAFTAEIHEALLGALFRSNAWIAVCMITDLFGSTQRFNVPGAIADSNWSERLHNTVAGWRSDSQLCAKMDRIRDLLDASGRS